MTTAINRTTVRIPTPSGEQIEAGYYQPDGAGPFHAVLMGHGMGAVKAGGLQPFAERFSREGFAVVAIDYRRWGGSTGQPRDEALAAIPQCAQNAMSGTTYSHSMHSTGSSGLMASCSSCRSAACSTVGRAIRASPQHGTLAGDGSGRELRGQPGHGGGGGEAERRQRPNHEPVQRFPGVGARHSHQRHGQDHLRIPV
jgi:predicted alpha/beta hydrolase